MANNVANVVAGKPLTTGGVWSAPRGTALPTDASTALAGTYVALGYIGEDGLTETTARSTEKIKAWGGDIVKIVQTDFSVTYQFTFIESLNGDVLKEVYGAANVTTTAATSSAGTKQSVKIVADQLPHRLYVFEIKDGPARVRVVVPDGQITEVADVTYNDGSVIGYQVTVEAFRDVTLGAQAVKHTDDGVFSA